jgi:hypothetical protein
MLAVDVMFVNGVPFLVSAAKGLNLVTAKFTPSCMAKQLAANITRMMLFQFVVPIKLDFFCLFLLLK